MGKQEVLELGNLDAKRDWGSARDSVDGVWRMLQAEVPNTHVEATGRTEFEREYGVDSATLAARFNSRIEQVAEAQRQLAAVQAGTSWRVTEPMRALCFVAGRRGGTMRRLVR